jgi:hypothetical protein
MPLLIKHRTTDVLRAQEGASATTEGLHCPPSLGGQRAEPGLLAGWGFGWWTPSLGFLKWLQADNQATYFECWLKPGLSSLFPELFLALIPRGEM